MAGFTKDLLVALSSNSSGTSSTSLGELNPQSTGLRDASGEQVSQFGYVGSWSRFHLISRWHETFQSELHSWCWAT